MKYFSLVFAVLIVTSSAFANTASIGGISYSISLEKCSSYIEYHLLETYFTTYDGNRYSMPLYDYDNGYYYYSQELKKVGSLYKTDYLMIVDTYTVGDYGEISLNLGSDDVNGNGIDDVCEKSMPFNKNITGNWYSQNNTGGLISGSLSKAANSAIGTYSLTAHNTYYAGDMSMSGNYTVGELSGTLDYSKTSNSITVAYTSTLMQSEETYEATYDIIDEDNIRINAVESFPATIFSRDGNTYTALVELSDGDLDTSWPDYQKWLVIIQDTNDTDGDGVPDLSDLSLPVDPPEPKFMPWLQLLLED